MVTTSAHADTLRIATYAAPLSREGPAILLRDLRKGEDPQINAIVSVIAQATPDVLVLTDFDYDLDGLALDTFAQILRGAGADYPYRFAALPNTGMQTGLDLDGDGFAGGARDGQGYGRFSGDGGLAILSRHPIDVANFRDLSGLLWRDLAGAVLPQVDGAPFPSQAALAVQRLSTSGHWMIPVLVPDAPPLTLMAWSATPPVFDGDEDRNGLRNRDELRLWENLIADEAPARFVVIGNANLDPVDGQGHTGAMAAFLQNPAIQDPAPRSEGAARAADPTHGGDPATDTADWDSDIPGNLRVSYVLPSADWTVLDAGVFWPDDDKTAGPHHLVWVDLRD